MTKKLIVGFSTRITDEKLVESLMPEFKAPSNYKEEAAIKKYVDERKAAFLLEAKNMPYTGTFERVVIADTAKEVVQSWKAEGREPGTGKQSVALAVRAWLLKNYPNAWANDTHEVRKPEVVFLGFNVRLFVKLLGIECSLPQNAQPLPPKLWYSSSDYRDIGVAVLPDEFKLLSLQSVLLARRPVNEDDAAKWDKILKKWTEPGMDPSADVTLATELAAQLGFLTED